MTPATATQDEARSTAAVDARGLTLRFGDQVALDDISLCVDPGELVGLVGPDGAGKTTLLRIAAGLLVPDAGTCRVLGLDAVDDTIEIRQRIGYMPQKFGLYEDLTVQENLDLYADLQGVDPAHRAERYDQLLDMTALGSFTRRRAGRLSGGMKQKLGLACALIKSPGLLLLDEPTVGVDPVSRRDLWEIVFRLVEEDGIGVLLSTSYLDEAERCHRAVVLFDGAIAAEGQPKELAGRVEGRVHEWAFDRESAARTARAKALGDPAVIDATIGSGRVRVVVASDRPDDSHLESLAGEAASTHEVAPRFEDAFMDLAAERAGGDESGRVLSPMEMTGDAGSAKPDDGSEPETIIHVRDLVKRFGDFTAVSDVSFDVRRGETFGLLGPNGAGKSATFRMLCGLLPVTSGEVEVAGHDLRTSPARARERLGYMAQRFSLYAQLTVEKNLRFFGQAYGLGRSKLRERIEWAYDEFGLERWSRVDAGALPGGYKQRLAMAAALLHEPEILFLDEPTSGVDPLARREFWQRITAVAERGVTVIVTTHFLEEAEYCDRMLILSNGEPLALGSPRAIRDLVSEEQRDASIEDAFIALAEGRVDPSGTAADPRQGPERGEEAT